MRGDGHTTLRVDVVDGGRRGLEGIDWRLHAHANEVIAGIRHFLAGDHEGTVRVRGQPFAEARGEHAVVVGDRKDIQTGSRRFVTKRPRRQGPIARKGVNVKVADEHDVFACRDWRAHRYAICHRPDDQASRDTHDEDAGRSARCHSPHDDIPAIGPSTWNQPPAAHAT